MAAPAGLAGLPPNQRLRAGVRSKGRGLIVGQPWAGACWLARGAHPPPSFRPWPAGYPFDVPAEDACLLAYAALSYHLPLIVPFSVKERTQFVWGGCMLFRTSEMRHDSRGILRVSGGLERGWLAEGWRAGGWRAGAPTLRRVPCVRQRGQVQLGHGRCWTAGVMCTCCRSAAGLGGWRLLG